MIIPPYHRSQCHTVTSEPGANGAAIPLTAGYGIIICMVGTIGYFCGIIGREVSLSNTNGCTR